MAIANANGCRFFYQLTGRGVPLVLVHGSWGSHASWRLVAPELVEHFQVLIYDRRGHSASERPAEQGSVREDVADLVALLDRLGLGPAWVAGNSFGASIALWVAAERPDVVRGVIAHEPPLFTVLEGDPDLVAILAEDLLKIDSVAERIATGDHAGAAEQFVETVAVGPGAWAQLAPEVQQTLIENAPTFLDEMRDPERHAIDLLRVAAFTGPVLLTKGDGSPPKFTMVVRNLATALTSARVYTFQGAGHVPHATHPDKYVESTLEFIRSSEK